MNNEETDVLRLEIAQMYVVDKYYNQYHLKQSSLT